MRICPDTNVLARAIVAPATAEDGRQARLAQETLRGVDEVVLTLPALCELAWVLQSAYRTPAADIAVTIRTLIGARNVSCDRAAIAFGLDIAAAGGDFADGVIAEAGFLAGADRFVSFDRRAVRLVAATGRDAAVPT